MTVTLFDSQGNFFQDDIINEQNFDDQIVFYGALLCGGWIVKIDNITYTPIKLPEFLKSMQRLKNIGDIYNLFLPYLTYIQHERYIQVSEFLAKNQDLQNKIREAIDTAITTEKK